MYHILFNVLNDLLTLIFRIHGVLSHNRTKNSHRVFLDQFVLIITYVFQEPIPPLMNSSSLQNPPSLKIWVCKNKGAFSCPFSVFSLISIHDMFLSIWLYLF